MKLQYVYIDDIVLLSDERWMKKRASAPPTAGDTAEGRQAAAAIQRTHIVTIVLQPHRQQRARRSVLARRLNHRSIQASLHRSIPLLPSPASRLHKDMQALGMRPAARLGARPAAGAARAPVPLLPLRSGARAPFPALAPRRAAEKDTAPAEAEAEPSPAAGAGNGGAGASTGNGAAAPARQVPASAAAAAAAARASSGAAASSSSAPGSYQEDEGFSWGAFWGGPLPGKLAALLGLIVLSRVGVYVRLPGVDVDAFGETMAGNGLLGYVDALSGGSISKVGLFSLGIIPYINASIVLQLFSAAFPSLKKMQREDGPQGRARFQWYQKLAAFAFAIAQVRHGGGGGGAGAGGRGVGGSGAGGRRICGVALGRPGMQQRPGEGQSLSRRHCAACRACCEAPAPLPSPHPHPPTHTAGCGPADLPAAVCDRLQPRVAGGQHAGAGGGRHEPRVHRRHNHGAQAGVYWGHEGGGVGRKGAGGRRRPRRRLGA